MKTLPSKELLSEVLGYKVKDIVLSTENNLCFFSCNVEHRINIYELAHKCKEWAFNKGYELIEEVGRVVIKNNNGELLNGIHPPL